jgi:NADPH:quinone reductase-like Zn-dependent oxidoreductase
LQQEATMLAEGSVTARALYYIAQGRAECRNVRIPTLTDADKGRCALVKTLFSGVSRGTERLVFQGRLPSSEWQRMRCPHQEGNFPYPVKYGYAAVGRVEDGPADLLGQTVFALYPHQDRFILPAADLVPVPASVPPRRATLAANMETALNAVWDSTMSAGQTVLVIGAGIVGCLIAALAARFPGSQVTLVDIRRERAEIAAALGAGFALPGAADGGADVVFHTSASEAGLSRAIELAGFEARIVEVSWYGESRVTLPLGGAFHSQRLQIISSQVGSVSPLQRPRWPYRRRLETALRLLDDARLDALITEDAAFEDLPETLPRILADDAAGLATAVRYR